MIGKIISHYKIIEKIGEGGMGVVYKALDTNLDRIVALKFISHNFTVSEESNKRFIQEAKAIGALNHPNICTIHAIENHDSQYFIVMEYIVGSTLRDELNERATNLNENQGLRHILQEAIKITDAISEAHEHGIIHRDIKPENIMIDSKKRIKVMDFGLAKVKNSDYLTRAETTPGTLIYMSPEQIKGQALDQRSDIFSFGVVLYELLTGINPFRKEHEAATLYSIVNEEPPSILKIMPKAQRGLDQLLTRMLEKDPEQRYSSMIEVMSDLNQILEELPEKEAHIEKELLNLSHSMYTKRKTNGLSASVPAILPSFRSRAGLAMMSAVLAFILLAGYWLLPDFSPPATPLYDSIAVLPLENLSPDPYDAFFADGMHEEIINSLSGIGVIKVIARSSVLEYSPEGRNLARIGQELGVSTLMEGTVRRADERIRVSVQLIDTGNRTTIWSGTYEDHIQDVFGIQSRIAREVAGALQATLTATERQRLEERPTDNPQAYHFFIQGREYLGRSRFQADNPLSAERLLRRAVQEDPGFAHAWALLAFVYSDLYWSHGHTPDRLEHMREATEQAQRLAPDLAETKLALGLYHYWSDPDYEQTLSYFESVLQQFPNHPPLNFFTGMTQRHLGNWSQAETHFNRAIELDPRNLNHYHELSFLYHMLRDYDKAVAVSDRLLEMSPDASPRHLFTKLLYILARDGTFEGFESWRKEIYPSDPSKIAPFWWGYFYYYHNRDWEGALRSFANIESEIAWQSEIFFWLREFAIAMTLDIKGDIDAAHGYYALAHKQLEALRDEYPNDPRYRSALGKIYARMGEPEKAVQEGIIATELKPLTKDAFDGAYFEMELAYIYAWSGQTEKAIDKLELLLSIPSFAHRNLLRFNPDWDPLRSHPRFQALIS